MTITVPLAFYASTSSPATFNYHAPRPRRVRVTAHRKLRARPSTRSFDVIEGPWAALSSNSIVVAPELTLEEEFDLVADDTLAWAEEMLPIAAETWIEE